MSCYRIGLRNMCRHTETIMAPIGSRSLRPFNKYSILNPLVPHSRLSNYVCSKRTKSSITNEESENNGAFCNDVDHIVHRTPVVPFDLSPTEFIPLHINRPPYADTGIVSTTTEASERILIHDAWSAAKMRKAARLARQALDVACQLAQPGVTTDYIDKAVHFHIVKAGAYPSPLNYAGFPKSMCSSVNEVICHGIPDLRPLQFGDIVSFDVSCFLDGVHGDNCATVIVGDSSEGKKIDPTTECDWRGIPYRTEFTTDACRQHFVEARRLVAAAREALYQAIDTVRPKACLSEVGAACQDVAERHGYKSVTKYRGHGISSDFHVPPFVKHYRNNDKLELRPGMIFTIEPMIVTGSEACFEWEHDSWTVATVDGGLAAQFEHTVLVTNEGVEILTLPQ